jgi:AcrR family transcriptional regulator
MPAEMAFTSASFPPVQMFGGMMNNEQQDVVGNRRHILATARLLFTQNGVEHVNMQQIAQAANVSEHEIYEYFAHKGHICMILLGESTMRFQSDLLAYFEQAGERIAIVEQIYQTFVQLMPFTEENAPLLGAMLDVSGGDPRAQYYHSPFYLWIREVMMILLRRGINSKEIPEQDLDYVVDVVLAPLSVDFYSYQRYELGLSWQRVAAGLRRFLFFGLGVNNPDVEDEDPQ